MYVLGDTEPRTNQIVAIGPYGSALKVGYASFGGWDSFGPERLITRSNENILYEFDGKSALELYKRYLGEHAKGLPATGLLFPSCCVPMNLKRESCVPFWRQTKKIKA